jgi:2-keto-3-deoxy-L-rhamnonate aldolase RhmA
MAQNPLKARLAAGKPVLGAVMTQNSPEIAALLAGLGFDYLWFEMEHSPITIDGLRNMVLATRGLPAVPIARPPVNELWTAKRVLDQGALGVIFPFTRTGDQARQAVAACRYPPVGLRGSGASLAQLSWPPAKDYYDFADANILVIAMLEDASGVENIEEIAATPGLDVIFIGTSDLSFSLGLRGEQNHPKLQAAVDKVFAVGKKHGKFMGRPALTPAQVTEFTRQGFQFFMTRTDLELVAAGAAQLLDPLR